MADFHKLAFIIFFLLLPVIGGTSEDLKYSYEHDSLGDKNDATGNVTFRTHEDNGVIFEYAYVNIKWKGGFFKSSITDDFIQRKEIKNGLVLYDIVEGDQKKGYSVFARHIQVKDSPLVMKQKKLSKKKTDILILVTSIGYLNLKQKAKRILKLTDKLIKQFILNYGALDPLAQQTVNQGE